MEYTDTRTVVPGVLIDYSKPARDLLNEVSVGEIDTDLRGTDLDACKPLVARQDFLLVETFGGPWSLEASAPGPEGTWELADLQQTLALWRSDSALFCSLRIIAPRTICTNRFKDSYCPCLYSKDRRLYITALWDNLSLYASPFKFRIALVHS